MRSSSPSIGALAAALAGAQVEIVNPDKTAVGVLPSTRSEGRSFRYATLSAGLDLARKALGKRDIALLQTTVVDREGGWLRLESTLAHASGQWVSSDWPVCPLATALEPHKLGAAMTYARRYALFALIGIAGEDDLDAPDLDVTCASTTAKPGRLAEDPVSPPLVGANADKEDADALFACLTREIEEIAQEEELWRWAYRRIAARDALPRALAAQVEQRFEARVDELRSEARDDEVLRDEDGHVRRGDGEAPRTDENEEAAGAPTGTEVAQSASIEPPAAGGPVESSEPAAGLYPVAAMQILPPQPVAPKILRLRDKAHLRAIAHRPCLICGRSPADPHHLRCAQPIAMGRKASDEFVVPLCRLHHDEVHKRGDEAAWWAEQKIDPVPIALELWRASQDGTKPTDRKPEPETNVKTQSACERGERT